MPGFAKRSFKATTAALALCAIPGTAAFAQSDESFTQAFGAGLVVEGQPIILSADDVIYDGAGQTITASGNASAIYGERQLSADRLIYDEATGTLRAAGDVSLLNDDGSYLYADDAALSGDLSEGLITQPRGVIGGSGNFAAVEGRRIDDRYNVLSRARFSPCESCEENPTPLWRISAEKVIHDEEARDIIYKDATLDVAGVSVAYVPYFRHPDPSVKRRSGFLAPEAGFDDTIGYTLKTPYFFALAPDRDLTVTPFVSTEDVLLVEGEYRALTETGGYELFGTATFNDRRTGDTEFRGALEGFGEFEIDPTLRYGFDIDVASDDTFLRRYEYSDQDRTRSKLFGIAETERLYAEADLHYFQSFLPDEPSGELPLVLPEVRTRYRVLEDSDLGTATLTGGVLGLHRQQGRDVSRLNAGVQWERRILSAPGIAVTPFADARAEGYYVADDPAFDTDLTVRVNGTVGVDTRMPFIARNDLGQHIIEPIVQLVFATDNDETLNTPNEDSIDTEFDETTLFDTDSRFSGLDRFEDGARANVGIRYDFTADNGLAFEAVAGQVFRTEDNGAFSEASGLRGTESDYVGALRLSLAPYFDVAYRTRLDRDTLSPARSEVYARGEYGPLAVEGAYVFLEPDPASGFNEEREEIAAAAKLRLSRFWRTYGGARHDLDESRFVEYEGGLIYEDECVFIDLSIERRFNNDRDAEDGTNFGIKIRLKTLGA